MYRKPIYIVNVTEIFDNTVHTSFTLFERKEHALTSIEELFEIYLKKYKVRAIHHNNESMKTIEYVNDYIAEIKLHHKGAFYDDSKKYNAPEFIEI